jgi:hypothetical protein
MQKKFKFFFNNWFKKMETRAGRNFRQSGAEIEASQKLAGSVIMVE